MKIRKALWSCTLLMTGFAALAANPSVLFGQTVSGSIYGTVSDTSGAVIPDADVTVTNIDTGHALSTKSNTSGAFIFPVLDPGTYRVATSVTGFVSVTQQDLRLSANQNINASFTLRPGSEATVVTVDAGTTLIDTHESQIGETIDQRSIQDLPLVGRSAYDLVQTVTGITNYTPSAQIGDNIGTQFSVNGLRPNFNSYYLDGGYNNQFARGGGNLMPNPDALEEFRMLTTNFDAEFGHYPGGVVNVITRSGTNAFHGVAYDYLRNTVLTAGNYFTKGVSPLVYNVFGGGAGGPILRNRAFFYATYEGTRISSPTTITSSSLVVPTAAERTGDFSADSAKIKASLTHLTTCGNPYIICPTALDPVVQKMLALVPVGAPANSPTPGAPPQQMMASPTSQNEGSGRLDYQLNDAHKLQFTYFNSQGTAFDLNAQGNGILDYGGDTNYSGQYNYVLGDTWIVSERAVNSLRIFDTLNKTIIGNSVNGNTWADFGSSLGQNEPLNAQPFIDITGYWTMGTAGSGQANDSQGAYGILDTFNYTKGNHTLKFGGSFDMDYTRSNGQFLVAGKLGFTGSSTGNALADFLEGHANTFQQNNGTYSRYHSADPSLFLQDDWHIRPRLTLNLGARWEVYYPFAGMNNLTTFQEGVQSTRFPTAPLGVLVSGDPGVPDGILHVSYTKFAPRVGFAYDVFGTGKSSVRGGYGIFYSATQADLVGNLEQQPFSLVITLNQTPNLKAPYAPGADPFPYTVNLQNPTFEPGATMAGMAPGNSNIPYLQEYNLTVEQQLGDNWSARVAYVGSVGHHFYLLRDENSPIYIPGASTTTAGINKRRPIQPYAGISLWDTSSSSAFNSFQATTTHRFAHGFSINASYVWEKEFDNTSGDPTSTTAFQLANQNCVACDRGLSSLEVPQHFVASYLYQLPGTQMRGLLGKELLNGWQINGITTISTGSPFNILSGVDSNLDGIATDRPDRVGDPSLGGGRSRAQKIGEFFNTASFEPVPADTPYGNSPRDPIIGPGYVDTDLSAFKRFAIYESSDLLFRAEIFNTFNNVNLGTPNGTLTSSQFGKITSSNTPRIVQFALKYEF
jgi:Carboxypeptidase regulatory-like domain/TonB-dependent Receptor Plug Domain/TonB dependent receptor